MKKYTRTQRILAVIGIVLLVALYLTALVAAFVRNNALATQVLTAALFCTVAVPVIIWLFQFFIRKTGGKEDQPENSQE